MSLELENVLDKHANRLKVMLGKVHKVKGLARAQGLLPNESPASEHPFDAPSRIKVPGPRLRQKELEAGGHRVSGIKVPQPVGVKPPATS